MASVQLKNVCKKYPNGYEAVKDFNLDIQDKEFIIFVGNPAAANPLLCVWWPAWKTSLPAN